MTALTQILLAKFTGAVASTAILMMIVSAEINTAPDQLPTWHTIPQWLWTWQIHAGRMFLNLRNPGAQVQSATITDTHSVTASVTGPNASK